MDETRTVTLAVGKLELRLSPSTGGSIEALEYREDAGSRSVLRKCHTAIENVLEAGSFPLVPYVNRIRGGNFDFGGRQVRLQPNMAGDPSPLHGQGWLGAWTVETQSPSTATLVFQHEAGEWPWAYEARQSFTLDERGLSVELSCHNLSDEPMPCGLGQHPYFDCTGETRLDTEVSHAWTIDDQVLPVDKVPAVDRFDLRDRAVCGQGLDHGFGGWGGTARLSDPTWPYDVTLSSPSARFFQLYSPEDGGICVIEPVSHANAALNAPEEQWAELGMEVLEPGATMRLLMRIDVIAKAALPS
jgi:aldose 1-epimerase